MCFKNLRGWLWPILLVLAIFAVSSASRLATPNLGFTFSRDKLAHFLVFGLVATSIVRLPWFRQRGWRGVLYAAVLTSLYGACDEVRQSFTPGRSVEFADWVADTVGSMVATVIYFRWRTYRVILEWAPFGGKRKRRPSKTDRRHRPVDDPRPSVEAF